MEALQLPFKLNGGLIRSKLYQPDWYNRIEIETDDKNSGNIDLRWGIIPAHGRYR
jgi:hypothetical protein